MLKRLESAGYITYAPYQPAELTPPGRTVALRILRRHRLWETFLARQLGLPWTDVYPQACDLEHATSEVVEEALEKYLGFPPTCPHGFPIPDAQGRAEVLAAQPLSSLPAGSSGRVTRTGERQTELLRYLAGKGLQPGALVCVSEITPIDGTITIQVGESSVSLSPGMAHLILVERIP
jgi:DtxR family transcriptional regulator, Mn-dependent transcriptional regulator